MLTRVLTYFVIVLLAGNLLALDASFRSYIESPGATSTSVVIPKPSGLAAKDLMIAHVIFQKGPRNIGDIVPPAGWTTLYNVGFYTLDHVGVFWKLANATDVSATAFTFTGTSSVNKGAMTAWYNVDQTTPVGYANAAYQNSLGIYAVNLNTFAPPKTNALMVVNASAYGVVKSKRFSTCQTNASTDFGTLTYAVSNFNSVALGMWHGRIRGTGAVDQTYAKWSNGEYDYTWCQVLSINDNTSSATRVALYWSNPVINEENW